MAQERPRTYFDISIGGKAVSYFIAWLSAVQLVMVEQRMRASFGWFGLEPSTDWGELVLFCYYAFFSFWGR